MELKHWILIALSFIGMVSCSDNDESDAYGQFEADEVMISAETNGRLTSFTVEEGDKLEKGERIATVDTTQLHLQKLELIASMNSVQSNFNKLDSQKEVLQTQLETAQKELKRVQALKRDNAATQQQIDSAEGRVNTLQKQIKSIDVDKQSVSTELNLIEAKNAQINDQIERATITNPINGTVLTTFVEEHELVSPGRSLYRIANLDEMTLRVYIPGAQLPQVRLRESVDVFIDKNADENEQLSGEISWIASEAEFTPRMIQTKEERVTQVYAVKVRVPNPEGKIKIGMPGEIKFKNSADQN